MKLNQPEPEESDLPIELSQPARRALVAAGFTHLEQLTTISEAEVKRLHGMGPKGIRLLQSALAAKGLVFAAGSKQHE